jgi:tetratricopeptide (TPR) repeat protein
MVGQAPKMGTVLPFPAEDDAAASTISDEGMVQVSTPALLLGRGALVGRYVIIDLLGRGGMGTVYAAYDPELDRRVALKLVTADAGSNGGSGSGGRMRLQREAQALAKLQHPNVVAVHDVGTFDSRVFLAMELVEGTTLAKWLAAKPRSWRETVAMFVQAGQGLAAAHSSGIVHRDFKPQNVLIDREDRVRVADFGLARVAAEQQRHEDDDVVARAPTELASTPIRVSTPLTRTGLFLGTPAYASPEQLIGKRTDVHSDQFSFCITLYEALYGERPFAGDTEAELLGAIRDGAVRPPPAGSRVPKWLREAVVRGLHADPEKRHPSMEALLIQLRRQPITRRRVALAAGALVLAMGAGVFAARGTARHASVCENPRQRLMGIWDDARRDAVRAAFTRSGLPYAGDAFRSIERVMDDYAGRWGAAFAESCEGTERGEPEAYLRVGCLTQLSQQMRAQSDLLAQADPQVVENGVRMVQSLPPIGRCSKAGVSALPAPPPAHLHAQVEELRARLAQARALGQSGRYAEGLAIASQAARAAQSLGYGAVEAEALYERGILEDGSGNLDAAAKTLREASLAAEASRHDHLIADARLELVSVDGERSRYADAHEESRRALAAIGRLGGDEPLRAVLLNRIGGIYWREGKIDDAIETHRQALALAERVLPPQDRNLAWILNDLGVALLANHQYDEALGHLERARAIKEALLGGAHPDVGRTLNNIGWIEMLRGNLANAAADTMRALAIEERAMGHAHPEVASARCSVATVKLTQGEFAAARGLAAQALRDMEEGLGAEHPALVEPLTILGRALIEQHTPEEAIAPLERALALPSGHFAVGDERADTKFALARALGAAERDRDRARKLAQEALAAYNATDPASQDAERAKAWLDALR